MAITASAEEAVRLEKGERAPFSGVLLSDADAAKLLTDVEACQGEMKIKLEEAEEKCREEVSYIAAKSKLEFDYKSKACDVENEYCQRHVELLQKQLDRELKPNLLKDPKLAFFGGMLTASTAAVLLTVAVNQLQQASSP